MKIAVIGAGISGLTTAFYLRRHRPDWAVTVLEAGAEAGGTMRTATVDGFLFERGSNGFLDNKPGTLALVRDAGAEALLLRSNDAARLRFIYHRGAVHPLPQSPPAFLKTKLLSLRGKLRVLGEPFVAPKRGDEEESLKAFGDRRLGPEFTDVFLNAMSAGIFGSTPEKLCVDAAFPLVVRLEKEHGGLFRGMLARRKREAGPGGTLMSFRGGVGTFVAHLAASFGDALRLNAAVRSLARADGQWQVTTDEGEERFDQLVLAVPAFEASRLLGPVDAALADELALIEYSPISVVGLGYDALAHPLHGFGLLTTAAAGLDVLGILWDSTIFPDRAPAGCKAIRIMIGGQRQPALALADAEALIAMARADAKRTMGITETPRVTFVQRWPQGIPNYRVGHLAAMDRLFGRVASHPGLALNVNAYRGVGVNDCVEQGQRLAASVAGVTA